MRLKGIIVEWKDDRGFGFIEPDGGGERVFCQVKAFSIRVRRPMPGDGVTYGTARDKQGRLQATQVRPAGLEDARYNANVGSRRAPQRDEVCAPTAPSSSASSIVVPCIGSAMFFIVIATLVARGQILLFVPLIYLIMSGITIFAYAFDKSAAMNRRWRTQEQMLHLLPRRKMRATHPLAISVRSERRKLPSILWMARDARCTFIRKRLAASGASVVLP